MSGLKSMSDAIAYQGTMALMGISVPLTEKILPPIPEVNKYCPFCKTKFIVACNVDGWGYRCQDALCSLNHALIHPDDMEKL